MLEETLTPFSLYVNVTETVPDSVNLLGVISGNVSSSS